MEKIAETYTIRLCKNGVEFKVLTNVVDDHHGRPTSVGEVIEQRWKVLGVIRHSINELVVDVDEV